MRGPRLVWSVTAALALLLPLPFARSDYVLFLLVMCANHALLAVSLNVVFGYLGLIALGHAGFYGIGAYVSAALTMWAGLPFALALLGAALAAALSGLALAIPALRVRGHYFVLITLGFGEIVRLILLNWKSVTRGTDGVVGVPAPAFGPLTISSKMGFYYLTLLVAVLAILLTERLRRSKFGRALIAIRGSEMAAATSGVDPALAKLLAFTFSAWIAGSAGSLYAHFYTFISPEVFTIDISVAALLMVLLGGAGSNLGAVVGAGLLTLLPEALRFLKELYLILYGAGIVLVMVFMPDGLVGIARRLGRPRGAVRAGEAVP
ncbi:MAG: branched-chain amino acid ABC transporter permease [Deltaproteobacteria bacterium]|nr:branched-chain amino acid ABC transporter permease [Deltaproteobacteria bacterium]